MNGPHHWDQLYLSEIRYADYGDQANPQFLVRVKFDYENRPDSFSDYRAGFEIRTIRRCMRIQVSTHADKERLSRSYHLRYLDQQNPLVHSLPINKVSLLHQVLVEGHDETQSEFLPPAEIRYSQFQPATRNSPPLAAPSRRL